MYERERERERENVRKWGKIEIHYSDNQKKKEKNETQFGTRERERERYWIVDRIVFYSSSPCFNSLRKSTLFFSSSLNSFFSVALSAVTLKAGSSFLAAILVKRDPTLDTFFN